MKLKEKYIDSSQIKFSEKEKVIGIEHSYLLRSPILGAKTVGIDSAGVLYGYGDRAELEAAGADYILPAIPDLEELLLE